MARPHGLRGRGAFLNSDVNNVMLAQRRTNSETLYPRLATQMDSLNPGDVRIPAVDYRIFLILAFVSHVFTKKPAFLTLCLITAIPS